MATNPSDRPNIVMLVVDQWRADCFGLAGHPVVRTPNIDQIFGSGTVFDRAYAAVPSCIAARASLLTGMSQEHHGRVGYREAVAWDYPQTIATVLSSAGYLCHAVGKMHVFPARRRMGFHDVELHDGYTFERFGRDDYGLVDDYRVWLRERARPDSDIVDAGIGCNGYAVRPFPLADDLHPTAWAVTRAIDFLRRRDPTMPFFLKVSFHRPHPPLDPPAWYLSQYADATLPPIVQADWVEPDQPLRPIVTDDSPIPTDAASVDLARRAYYAQLSFIDNQLNRLVHALIEAGVLRSTALVLVGDHGEQLYDHGLVGKSMPYEPSARVPLMMRLPGAFRTAAATPRVTAPVELMDVLPTLCDMAGADVPATVDGCSVMPWLTGSAPAEWRDVVHGEHYNGGRYDHHYLTDGHHKYVWFAQSGREQLFDLDDDPEERRDLARDASGVVLDGWRGRLVKALADREEGFVVDGELRTGAETRPVLESAGLLSAEQAERQRVECRAVRRFFLAQAGDR